MPSNCIKFTNLLSDPDDQKLFKYERCKLKMKTT